MVRINHQGQYLL